MSTLSEDMPLHRDVTLFFHACRLVTAAQRIRRGRAVPDVLETMCRLRGLPSSVGAAAGHRAVSRAAFRLARLGLVNTCLIRSLALAALLADRKNVRLHLGFRIAGPSEAPLSGHAWVTLGGRALPDDRATLADGEPCEEVAVLTASRSGTGRYGLEGP